VLGVQGGQVRLLRETEGPQEVLTVDVGRIDARVIHPSMQVISDDRKTLQAQLAASREEVEALRREKEREEDLLRRDIRNLQSELKAQVVAALVLRSTVC